MKNTIFRMIGAAYFFTSSVYAGTPNEIASSIHIEKNIVEHEETLFIVAALQDDKFNDVTDAHPTLIFDGNTSKMKYSMTQHNEYKSAYSFTIQVADGNTSKVQDVNITIRGNYKGNPYVFSRKSAQVSFQ